MAGPDINTAVSDYLCREAIANRTPQGANHAELLEVVATEYGTTTQVLTSAVLDATTMGGAG